MIPKLNDAMIRNRSSHQSFERGQHYYRQGSVCDLIQRGNVLSANVKGSEVEPYQIKICFDSGGITRATCTCPYHFEEWCKHIVATLLACVHHPEQLEQRPSLADLLKPLTREQLQTIVETIAQTQPDWLDEIEAQVARLTSSKSLSKSPRRTTIDPKPIEQQVKRLAQGWKYLPLQKVLQGEITELGAWEDEAPDFADDLALIRLKILERQGRSQEYLYLAEAEGQTDRYLQMLVKMGRTEEAISEAQQISTPAEALALARTLRELGDFDRAIQIAKQGLSLEGDRKPELAVWTSDLAEGIDRAIALEARLIAFQLLPSLSDYLKIQELSDEQWITLREELLSILRQRTHESCVKAKTAIFLEEGLLDDAISAVDQASSYWSEVIHPVMSAAISHRPEWVIENAVRRAESIMNDGKAQYYYFAAQWLRQVRAAYLQLGRAEDWKRYRAALLQTHTRKRKLIALLQARDLA